MKIRVNGTEHDSDAASLADLLVELGQGGAKVATAVNEKFVAATMRDDHRLQSGDRVEIVSPRQGG